MPFLNCNGRTEFNGLANVYWRHAFDCLLCGFPEQPLSIFSATAKVWFSGLLLYSDDWHETWVVQKVLPSK